MNNKNDSMWDHQLTKTDRRKLELWDELLEYARDFHIEAYTHLEGHSTTNCELCNLLTKAAKLQENP